MWEPLDITTPEAWKCFAARQIGNASWGFAAAFSFHVFALGIEVLGSKPGDARGLALMIGPLWIGVGRLTARGPQ